MILTNATVENSKDITSFGEHYICAVQLFIHGDIMSKITEKEKKMLDGYVKEMASQFEKNLKSGIKDITNKMI